MTVFSDDFNRANGLGLGANWTAVTAGQFEVLNNQIECNANSTEIAAYVATATATFAADQLARAVIGTLDADNNVGIMVRCSASGAGYAIINVSAITAQLYRVNVSGTDTALGSAFTVANGNTIELEVIGTTITARVNSVQQSQVTDSTYASGQPGVYGYNGDSTNETTLDDFYASDEFGGGASVRTLLLMGAG